MLLAEDGSLGEDHWRHLNDEEAIPASGPVTVSLAQWQKAEPALRERRDPLGLRLPNTIAPQEIAADLAHFALLVLSFPKFTDGRAYSQARLLRTRFAYAGELRAAGEVLRDQLLFMRRCGFNSFVVGERAVKESWATAFGEFDVFYQEAPDGRPWVMRQRLGPRTP
ncbi:MAG TPA: DUF934 domain-containing protein [Stellaceae bacterium]|nr:DUF934 domain-containing protein [Stellaceae bacterium]